MWYAFSQAQLAPVVPDEPGVDEVHKSELDAFMKSPPKVAPPSPAPALIDFSKPPAGIDEVEKVEDSPDDVQSQLELEREVEERERLNMEQAGLKSFADDDSPIEQKQEDQDIEKLSQGGPDGDFLSFLGQNFPNIKLPKVHDNCTCQATENGWVLGHGEESCEECQALANQYDQALAQYKNSQKVSQANVWSKRYAFKTDHKLYNNLCEWRH